MSYQAHEEAYKKSYEEAQDLQELIKQPSRLWRKLYVSRAWLVLFGGIVFVVAYVGFLLFGNNSIEVLVRLKSQKAHLIEDTRVLEEQNARLQKQIFELRGLKP